MLRHGRPRSFGPQKTVHWPSPVPLAVLANLIGRVHQRSAGAEESIPGEHHLGRQCCILLLLPTLKRSAYRPILR